MEVGGSLNDCFHHPITPLMSPERTKRVWCYPSESELGFALWSPDFFKLQISFVCFLHSVYVKKLTFRREGGGSTVGVVIFIGGWGWRVCVVLERGLLRMLFDHMLMDSITCVLKHSF